MSNMVLPFRRRRKRQPQVAARIDWSNPITQGLAIAVMPNANGARELTLSTPSAKVGSPSNSVGSRGVASIGSGGANYFTFTDYDKYDLVGPITVIAVVDGISDLVSGGYLSKGPIDTANTPFFFGRSGSIVSLSRGGASDYQRFNTTNTIAVPNAPCVVGVTQNGILGSGATCNYYLNGVTPGSSAGGSMANTVAAANALPVRFAGTTEKVYLALAFNRVLSGAEIKSLSANPWQIFQPLPARIFVPMSAGSVSDLIISMTKANALATGVQAQILYDQLIQMLSASATTPSKSFNIDKTLDLLKANAQATGTQFNVDIAMLLAMAVANAQATGVKANIDKAINIQSGNSIASGGNILLDKAIGLAFANSNASGVKLNIDKTINTAVANAQASGITTLLDIVKNLVVGNAVANSNGFGSGSVLNLNSISGIATGTKVALDKVINQAVATATANAPKFNLDKSINTIVANALATGIITNLDRQILANSASAIATGITTILEYSTALAMNSGSASATGTTIRIDKQILISAGIANATGVDVSVVFAPFTYEPAFIIFSSETDLVVLDVVRGDIIAAPQQQMLQTLNPESRNNSFNVDSRGVISAPEQILQSLVSESRTNVFDSTTRISTFNRE